MAASGTGHHPHVGGTGTGQRRRPPAESVLSKAQSSPTVLLTLLYPFLPALERDLSGVYPRSKRTPHSNDPFQRFPSPPTQTSCDCSS